MIGMDGIKQPTNKRNGRNNLAIFIFFSTVTGCFLFVLYELYMFLLVVVVSTLCVWIVVIFLFSEF